MDIMIVEDESIIRLSLRKIIESESTGSFKVVGEAKDGDAALSLVESRNPDVIITDIRMPVMDGLSFIEKLQLEQCSFDVVILSGYNDFAYARRSMRLGAADYLLKPVDPEELMQVLRRIKLRRAVFENATNQRIRWFRICQGVAGQLRENITMSDEKQMRNALAKLYELIRLESDGHLNGKEMFDIFTGLLEDELRQAHDGQGIEFGGIQFSDDGEQNFQLLKRRLLDTLEEVRVKRNWGAGLIVLRAVEFVETHYMIPNMRLQQLADDLNVSMWYLSRVFKSETGKNFISFVTDYRLQRAKELMANPEMRLQSVSEMVGYVEYAHFSRIFKKKHGMTPSEYRRMHALPHQSTRL